MRTIINDNIEQLQRKSYKYIPGARIKNDSRPIKKEIPASKLKNGENVAPKKEDKVNSLLPFQKRGQKRCS